MTFEALLAQVIEVLQREERVSYRALQRRFDLDDAYLEDLKVGTDRGETAGQGRKWPHPGPAGA